MGHYALLDQNNVVTDVFVGKDEGEDGIDWETHYGELAGQVCKRTSYNTEAGQHKAGGTPFRKNYAGIGFTYDAQRDAFIAEKPYDNWVLDEEACIWVQPIPKPQDGKNYVWDQANTQWIEYADPETPQSAG